MTESEYLVSTDPAAMLFQLLGREPQGDQTAWGRMPVASDRKLRLFACACFRGTVHTPSAKIENRWVETGIDQEGRSADAAGVALDWARTKAKNGTGAEGAALLRDIFGSPWKSQRIVCMARSAKQLLFGTDTNRVKSIAQRIYDDRTFEDMPILADALEDAGCEDDEILKHCRGMERCPECSGAGFILNRWCTPCEHKGWIPLRGPHVRGCFVLDLMLGKVW